MKHASGPISTCFDQLRRCEPLRSAVSTVRDWRCAAIDRWLRIDTAARGGSRSLNTLYDDPVYYEATDYLLLRRYMRPIQLAPGDVVYDIGCGLGRTLCMFARRNVRKCVGIEVSRELAAKARQNAARLRGRCAPIEIRDNDAVLAEYDEGTVFWLNNPFGRETLNAVLQAIARSVGARPRPIQIAYIYPFCKEAFDSHRWLRCVHRERSVFHGTSEALYWRTEDAANSSVFPAAPRAQQVPEAAWASGGS